MKEIIIDPRLKYNYASWYLLGIQKLLRGYRISYNVNPFKELKYETTTDYNSGFAFIIRNGHQEKKIFIDTEDVAKIFQDRYVWCHAYGMVNPTKEQVERYEKLIAIGPEFGITIGNRIITFIRCIKNYMRGKSVCDILFKNYIRDYLYTNIRRRPLKTYEEKAKARNNYIFHASTLWYNRFAATNTNMYRGEFLKACQKAGIHIEGGLFYINAEEVLEEMPDYPKYKEIYKDFIYESRLSIDDYIRKTKESIFVFNTPSVCECHGWKLAEYLCMGKAIISTPLTREMPCELIHGENVHFVECVEDIYDAVLQIKNDDIYRHKLECGARAYYEKWLAPEVVIKRIIEKAQQS